MTQILTALINDIAHALHLDPLYLILLIIVFIVMAPAISATRQAYR